MKLERRVAEPLENVRPTGLHAVPPSSSRRKPRWRKPVFIAGLMVVALVVAAAAVLGAKWPFTPPHVTADLEHATRTTVTFQHFHQTFFPPGCVLENVIFRNNRKPGSPPMLTVTKLSIVGSYSGLLREHVPLIRAEGAHVTLPPLRAGEAIFEAGSSTAHATIGEIVADGSILDITSGQPGNPPLRFQIRRLTIRNPGSGRAMEFRIDALNPKPQGELLLTGRTGPWKSGNAAATEFSGTYAFRHVQLGSFHGVAGTLSSEGKFHGPWNALNITGAADVPNFEVTRSHHPVRLTTQFDAVVHGTNGDVELPSIRGHWGRTTVTGTGRIAARPGSKGKFGGFDFFVRDGRIEDVLRLFVRSPQSPLAGATNFEAKVTIPPGKKKFVEKVVLDGNFVITDGQFTSSKTQTSIDKLSAQARGQKNPQDGENVFSDLRGHVLLTGGVAHFSTLRAQVPGAVANMHGTYGLENQRINLHGMLFLQAKLSQATSGIKSVLLKPLEPFLKKNRRGGAKMPASITGTYSHPKYSTDPI